MESKTGPNTVAIVAGILVGASIFSLCALLFLKRRRSKTQMYANVESPLPPTLDIIRSLGHDREAEFTAVPSNAMVLSSKSRSTSVSVQNTEDLVIMRRTYWPNSGVYDASKPSNIFNDVDLDEQVVRSTRRVYWPNDARHDATNPIHVFDDISVRSEELESSTSGTDSGGSLSSDDHQGIV